MYARFLASVTAFLASMAVAAFAHAGPIVTNGGFETGDFSGWSLSAPSETNWVDAGVQNSGDYSAIFGEFGAPIQLSQTLALEAGRSYQLAFWLSNIGGNIDNDAMANLFQASIGGTSLLAITDKTATEYQRYTFTFTAAGAASELVFDFRHDENFWLIDDISVNAVPDGSAVPEPSTLLLFGASLIAFALRRRA